MTRPHHGPARMNRVTSFALHIRPLFRELDIEKMSSWFDLSKYEEVRDHAESIYARLIDATSPMPPTYADGPWPDEWIALFRRWMDEKTPP
jgi:hypothetical protein